MENFHLQRRLRLHFPKNALVPLLSVVPLQLLAYYVAVDKGLDVDMPRNTKSCVKRGKNGSKIARKWSI